MDAPTDSAPGATSTNPDAAAPSANAKGQRIAKVMARAGLCSRRDAEAWIAAGRVTVNGDVLASAARDVTDADIVLVDDQPLPKAEKTRLFTFHKPRGLVTSDFDPEGRETVADFLRDNWPDGPRIVTIGRLDINTEGLLLLTNDGGLARQLELPETGWLRRYRVRAKGTTDQARLDELAAGVTIDGINYSGIDAKLDRIQGSNCWLTMGLREGKNREIKRVLEHIGLEVNRLIRLSFGPFQLLDLPEGVVEEVRTRILRDQLGPALAAAAGVLFEELAADADSTPPVRVDPPSGRQSAELKRDRRRDTSSNGALQSDQGDEADLARGRQARDATVPRRHISTLRQTRTAPDGPRRRTERSATKDRNDRAIAVERVMNAVPNRGGSRDRSSSPSAEGKRARIARSAPRDGAARDGDARRGRDQRDGSLTNKGLGERDRLRSSDVSRSRDGGGGRSTFGPSPPSGQGAERRFSRDDGGRSGPGDQPSRAFRRSDRSGERSDSRPARTGERPARTGERPARTGERPARTGERPARTGERSARTGERPARTGERPARTGERPARTGERPARTGERPARTGERPARTGERPTRTSERPARTGERPARIGERPARTGERPARTGERSARTVEHPARTGERPARTGEHSTRTGERPVRTGERPARTGDRPTRTGERPARTGERPAGGRNRSFPGASKNSRTPPRGRWAPRDGSGRPPNRSGPRPPSKPKR